MWARAEWGHGCPGMCSPVAEVAGCAHWDFSEHRLASNGTRRPRAGWLAPVDGRWSIPARSAGSTCKQDSSGGGWGGGHLPSGVWCFEPAVAVFLLTWWFTPVTDRDPLPRCTSLTRTTRFTPAGRHRPAAHPSKNASISRALGRRPRHRSHSSRPPGPRVLASKGEREMHERETLDD